MIVHERGDRMYRGGEWLEWDGAYWRLSSSPDAETIRTLERRLLEQTGRADRLQDTILELLRK